MADLRKPMTETEKRLFKEAIIREYQLKHEKPKNPLFDKLLKELRSLVPFNIIIGLVAAVILVYFWGIKTLAYILLLGIIWATIISTIASLLVKK